MQCNSRSRLHRHDKIAHDVVFALGGVLAHVEGQDRRGLGARLYSTLVNLPAWVVEFKGVSLGGPGFA